MPGDYTSQTVSTLRLIRDKGQGVTFSRDTNTVDPVTGKQTDPPSDPTTWRGHALRTAAYKGSDFASFGEAFKRQLVVGKAIILLVPAGQLANAPIPGDVITLDDGSVWTIMGLTSLAPSGTPILYTIGGVAA